MNNTVILFKTGSVFSFVFIRDLRYLLE